MVGNAASGPTVARGPIAQLARRHGCIWLFAFTDKRIGKDWRCVHRVAYRGASLGASRVGSGTPDAHVCEPVPAAILGNAAIAVHDTCVERHIVRAIATLGLAGTSRRTRPRGRDGLAIDAGQFELHAPARKVREPLASRPRVGPEGPRKVSTIVEKVKRAVPRLE